MRVRRRRRSRLASPPRSIRASTACGVSGYFGPRENLWQEPIDRNVFGLLEQFGDAELAALIAPRKLIVEQRAELPAWQSEPGRTPGALEPAPRLPTCKAEAERARAARQRVCRRPPRILAGDAGRGPDEAPGARGPAGAAQTCSAPQQKSPSRRHADRRRTGQASGRQSAASDSSTSWSADTQRLLREGEFTRDKFWAKADRGRGRSRSGRRPTKPYREYFCDEVIGRFDQPLLPPNVRTRKVYDEPKYTGYEVVLDVFPDVIAYGILLLPKDLKPGEKRPVVVCQHGLEGRPQDVADPQGRRSGLPRSSPAKLAERGFITFAPQNLYIFKDRFRTLQRKANPLGKTLFSIIVPQHQQIVDWLQTLPYVDPRADRLLRPVATAARRPCASRRWSTDYCLSICSADFNEWVWKNASTPRPVQLRLDRRVRDLRVGPGQHVQLRRDGRR